MRRGWLAGAAGLAAIGGAGWYFFAPEAEAPYVAERAGPTAEELAAKAEASEQLAAAVAAAFPRGTLIAGASGTARSYDEHRLIEAAFGPVLVSEGRALGGGPADDGALGVHYLAPSETGFRLVQAWPEAVAGDGELSGWGISEAFTDLPVIRTESGRTRQGIACATTMLTELTPRGPVELASIRTGYDDSGAKAQGATSLEGTIGGIAKGKGFLVRYSGTRSFAERYRRKGDRFVPEGGASRAPSC